MVPFIDAATYCIQFSHELFIGIAACHKNSSILRFALSVKPLLTQTSAEMKVFLDIVQITNVSEQPIGKFLTII